jgi:hypothetical protein
MLFHNMVCPTVALSSAGVDRRQSDSRFQRDLAMNGAGIMAPPFDAAYPLHIMQGLPFHPTKYVPRNKRAPQLAPIPTRKRSSIPIVAPPPDDEVLKGPDEALVNMGVVDNQVLKTKGPIKQETGTNAVPELCLSLRPRPSSISSRGVFHGGGPEGVQICAVVGQSKGSR